MNIFYIIGVVVVVLFILGYFGLRGEIGGGGGALYCGGGSRRSAQIAPPL